MNKKKIITGVFLILLIVAAFIGYKIAGPAVSAKKQTYFYIKTGETLETVKKNLVSQKIITAVKMISRLICFVQGINICIISTMQISGRHRN